MTNRLLKCSTKLLIYLEIIAFLPHEQLKYSFIMTRQLFMIKSSSYFNLIIVFIQYLSPRVCVCVCVSTNIIVYNHFLIQLTNTHIFISQFRFLIKLLLKYIKQKYI